VIEKFNYVKKASGLKKARRRAFPKCANAEDLDKILSENINMKSQYGEFRGQPFYRKLVGGGSQKATIFVCQQGVNNLKLDGKLFVDATFGIVPLEFKQLLIVMGEIAGKPRPYAFVLMGSKKKELYE
jgi:hypothetical protein